MSTAILKQFGYPRYELINEDFGILFSNLITKLINRYLENTTNDILYQSKTKTKEILSGYGKHRSGFMFPCDIKIDIRMEFKSGNCVKLAQLKISSNSLSSRNSFPTVFILDLNYVILGCNSSILDLIYIYIYIGGFQEFHLKPKVINSIHLNFQLFLTEPYSIGNIFHKKNSKENQDKLELTIPQILNLEANELSTYEGIYLEQNI